MDREKVMERVARDLEQGLTHRAANRLAGYLSVHPRDLVAREKLAEVHRATGNWAEAGRWGYFAEVRDPKAVKAFEKAFTSVAQRRNALRWPAGDPSAAPPIVAERLAALEAQAVGAPKVRKVPKVRQVPRVPTVPRAPRAPKARTVPKKVRARSVKEDLLPGERFGCLGCSFSITVIVLLVVGFFTVIDWLT